MSGEESLNQRSSKEDELAKIQNYISAHFSDADSMRNSVNVILNKDHESITTTELVYVVIATLQATSSESNGFALIANDRLVSAIEGHQKEIAKLERPLRSIESAITACKSALGMIGGISGSINSIGTSIISKMGRR